MDDAYGIVGSKNACHQRRTLPMSSDSVPGENSKAIGILCALTVVALFAGFTLVSRLGFTTVLTVPDIAMLRFGIAGLLLFPVFLKYGLGTLKWHQAAGLAFTGGLGFALLAYTGFRLAPASHGAVLLHGTIPLFTFVIVYWTLREAVKRAQQIGLVLILAGIIAMAWDSLSGATRLQALGDGALLLAAICWSAYGVTVKRLRVPPVQAASIVATFSMVSFVPVYFLLPGKALHLAAWQDILVQGAFQGVLLGVLSIFVYTRAVASLGAQQTALFTAAVPCITTVLAAFLLKEMPSSAALLGVVMVTAGMAIAMGNALQR
jgi:drug/metabolite transporter (DMT)-like permease